jgi:hypothetical protein
MAHARVRESSLRKLGYAFPVDPATNQPLDLEFDRLGREVSAEIANFRVMFDRRLRWQTRMIVGTAIGSVVVSVALSHLLA